MFCSHGNTLPPVSYTHLDVYKRQLQWLHFPAKPIEVLIAITILVSAFHALKPIYPKREVIIAGLFGLVHGLAFAETLTNLDLSTTQMVLSRSLIHIEMCIRDRVITTSGF